MNFMNVMNISRGLPSARLINSYLLCSLEKLINNKELTVSEQSAPLWRQAP
jgi:hypothetical protein